MPVGSDPLPGREIAGFRLEHGSPGIDREPPTLGEHTDEILGEAGYSAEEIARLRRDAVV